MLSHTAGDLPAGVTFSEGTFSGTPTQTGEFSGIVIQAMDATEATKILDLFTDRLSGAPLYLGSG